MLLDLKFSIGTLGIGSGAFIASLYGMNLKNFIEESDLGFLGVTAWSFVFAAVVCSYGLKKLRKVQRLTMWGERRRPSPSDAPSSGSRWPSLFGGGKSKNRDMSRSEWKDVRMLGEGRIERDRAERMRRVKELRQEQTANGNGVNEYANAVRAHQWQLQQQQPGLSGVRGGK